MANLRWILVPVVGVAAWYAAIFTVVAFDWLYWTFDYPCPREELTSGACPAVGFDWYFRYLDALTAVGAGLAAIYVVIACVWMAPKHKAWTALVVFGVGALVAGFMGRSMETYLPMVLAISAGAGTAVFLYRKHAVAKVA
jgi:hypothetical protein